MGIGVQHAICNCMCTGFRDLQDQVSANRSIMKPGTLTLVFMTVCVILYKTHKFSGIELGICLAVGMVIYCLVPISEKPGS